MTTLSPVEQLELGKKRLATLAERRTRVQVQLETARQQLAEGRDQAKALFAELTQDRVDHEAAMAKFEADPVGALKTLLAALEQANQEALAQFGKAVSDFDAYLTRIEQALANPDSIPDAIAKDPTLGFAIPEVVPAPVVARPVSHSDDI